MRRITGIGDFPVLCVETEEEGDVLVVSVFDSYQDSTSILTPIEYVSEQYISPRKKSRNSTG